MSRQNRFQRIQEIRRSSNQPSVGCRNVWHRRVAGPSRAVRDGITVPINNDERVLSPWAWRVFNDKFCYFGIGHEVSGLPSLVFCARVRESQPLTDPIYPYRIGIIAPSMSPFSHLAVKST